MAAIAIYGSDPAWLEGAELRERAAAAYDRCFCPAGVGRQMKAAVADAPRADALREVRLPALVIHGSRARSSTRAAAAAPQADPGRHIRRDRGMGHDYPPAVWEQWTSTWADFAATVSV